MAEEMQRLSRSQFFHMHLLKCDSCRREWLATYKEVPENKRARELERLIYANHPEG